MFRLSESCSHEVGLLFLLESCTSLGRNSLPDSPVGTEKLCTWVNPGPLREETFPLARICIKKVASSHKSPKKPRQNPPPDPNGFYPGTVSDFSISAAENLFLTLWKSNPTCPFVTHFDKKELAEPLFQSPEIPYQKEVQIYSSKTESGNCGHVLSLSPVSRQPLKISAFTEGAAAVGSFLTEKEWATLPNSLKLTGNEASNCEIKTRAQSNSADWFIERKSRLTASQFKAVVSRRKAVDDGFVQRLLVGGTLQTEAMRRGLELEDQSVNAGWDMIKGQFQIRGEIRHCGLVVNPCFPFLGATPDRVILSESGEIYPVEVKTPMFRGPVADYAETAAGIVNLCKNEVGGTTLF